MSRCHSYRRGATGIWIRNNPWASARAASEVGCECGCVLVAATTADAKQKSAAAAPQLFTKIESASRGVAHDIDASRIEEFNVLYCLNCQFRADLIANVGIDPADRKVMIAEWIIEIGFRDDRRYDPADGLWFVRIEIVAGVKLESLRPRAFVGIEQVVGTRHQRIGTGDER